MSDDKNAGFGEERRKWHRVLVDLEVDYGNEDNYLFAYIRDISATGLFVRTNTPEPVGTHLNVRFSEDQSGQPLELEAEVMWVNPYRPGHSDNLHPGMGIQFVELTGDQRGALIGLVKRFAYLDDTPADNIVPGVDTAANTNATDRPRRASSQGLEE